MKEFERSARLDDSFFAMHKIKPQISQKWETANRYMSKLEHKGKSVVITETLRNGLTDTVLLEFDGKMYPYNTVYEAEIAASEILKGMRV